MNKHGQSTIEYALIAVLVILGIVVMGPYVLRSVNAHFKLWDEGAQDSTRESLTQAPVTDVPPINTTCNCTTIEGSCNTTNCGTGYREYDYNCTPQGCNHASSSSYCKVDNSCCGLPVNLNCGSYPLPTDASGNINLSAETTPQPPTPGNCYYGQEIEGTTCGSTSSIQCVPNSCPMPACLGVITSNTTGCPNSPGTPGGPAITQNYGMTVVANCPTTPSPCQFTCADGYYLLNGVCAPIPCNTTTFSFGHNGAVSFQGNSISFAYPFPYNERISDDNAAIFCQVNGFNYVNSCTSALYCANSKSVNFYEYQLNGTASEPENHDIVSGKLSNLSFSYVGNYRACNSGILSQIVCSNCPGGSFAANGCYNPGYPNHSDHCTNCS